MTVHYQFTFFCDAPKCGVRAAGIFGDSAMDHQPNADLPDGWKALGPHKVYCPKHEIVQMKTVDGEVVEYSRRLGEKGGDPS